MGGNRSKVRLVLVIAAFVGAVAGFGIGWPPDQDSKVDPGPEHTEVSKNSPLFVLPLLVSTLVGLVSGIVVGGLPLLLWNVIAYEENAERADWDSRAALRDAIEEARRANDDSRPSP